MADSGGEGKRRITLGLSLTLLAHIDALKREWGMRNRGNVLERLLDEIFASEEAEPGDGVRAADGIAGTPQADGGEIYEQTALVLIGRGALEALDAEIDFEPGGRPPADPRRAGGSIDLPGFVRSRSEQLKRSLGAPATPGQEPTLAPLPQLSATALQDAMEASREHWVGLYGTPANETVLEAAMAWLGQDIWPQSDLSEGRMFTWSAACRVMGELVPGWSGDAPSFERVMVTAGLLEDPFSGATLAVRIPTLIRRFVHRFRRRRKGTSFQTLEHTMTLTGALKLLQLPTDPGHRLTLAQIREAYRELALNHHPDSGGSAEAMRRLNEAYQLLKELYRQGSGR